MSRWESEDRARKEILGLVSEYCRDFHGGAKPFEPGDVLRYSGRVYDEGDMCALVDAALDFWLTSGRHTLAFEKSFSDFLGVRYVSVVNSGSSANLLAFMALTSPELGDRRILPGDEIITVACAFPTTVTPILQYGAVPVFLDVTLPQYNIDVRGLEDALSERTKAVFLAHTLGNPFDIASVKRFCDKHSLWLIEDNCDALGSAYTLDGQTQYTGVWGDIATSSFYPPHHITMGEGGCVYTNNPLLHKLVRSFRDWGRECSCASGQDNLCGHRFDGQFGRLPRGYDHKYVYSHLGFNLKATDMQAAIGVSQMKKLPDFIRRRRHNWRLLRELLSDSLDALILPEPEPRSDPSWFGFLMSVREDSGIRRNDVTACLERAGIQTRLLFSGNIIRHPCFDELREGRDYRVCGSLENTDYVMNNGFWVGVYPGLDDARINYMADTIRSALKNKGVRK